MEATMPRQPKLPRVPTNPDIQPDATWQVGVASLHTWVEEREKPPYRPVAAVIMGMPSGFVLGSEIARAFSAPEIVAFIRKTARKPLTVPPHQPALVVCADATLAAELSPLLAPLGIACEPGPTPELDDTVASLDLHLRQGEPLPPGFSDAPGVTPERLAPLFAAAAAFYRQAPWSVFEDENPIEIHFPAAGGTTFSAIAMGAAGEQSGLALYRSFKALDIALRDLPPEEVTALVDNEAILFDDITVCAFSDLDAIARFGFEVAGDQAYPAPLILSRRGQIKTPTLADLDLYEAALRVVPVFLRDKLPAALAQDKPAEVVIGTTVAGQPVEVFLRYPPRAESRVPRTNSQPKRPSRPRRREGQT
jgi:hypothetical protein